MEMKKALRRTLLMARRAVPLQARRAADAAIAARLFELVFPEGYIFCYVGVDFEIRTVPVITAWLQAGRQVCVPLCSSERAVMTARAITSLGELSPGRMGLPEPSPDAKIVHAPAAVIVPGLSFTPQGYRLGRGGGYYDRYLSELPPQTPTIGLCYEAFLSDSLPREPHDAPVSAIITERRMFSCN